MMRIRRVVTWILAILTLAGAATGFYYGLDRYASSIYTYTTPLKSLPPPFRTSTASLTSHVVLVIADGVRYDSSSHMPYLNRLRRDGAQARLVLDAPANTQGAWTTLVSGAGPEMSDASLPGYRL